MAHTATLDIPTLPIPDSFHFLLGRAHFAPRLRPSDLALDLRTAPVTCTRTRGACI